MNGLNDENDVFVLVNVLAGNGSTDARALRLKTRGMPDEKAPVSKLGRTAADRPESIMDGRKPKSVSDDWGELLNDFRELVGN